MDSGKGWTPRLNGDGKPIYQAIADAIAADRDNGVLSPGTRLPPVRTLAERLGLDFTTVSRAYGEARRRGLVVGRVGQGTFVCAAPPAAETAPATAIDMSMNAPPIPADSKMLERMRREMAECAADIPPRIMFGYGTTAGAGEDRAAGITWLNRRLEGLDQERVLVCPGAQGALLALFSSLARPGDTVLCEALTYPGAKSLAAHLGLKLAGVAMDDQGLRPDAFRAACETLGARVLYCNPTLHNPTTVTWSEARRVEIAAIARHFGVVIVEDDAYGMLAPQSPPPLAALAPDLTYHVAGLAKCLAPGLRVAYLAVPDRRLALRATAALRATSMAACPVTTRLATRWIASGLADALLHAIRAEARIRQGIARDILPADSFRTADGAFHLWLPLPAGWRPTEFADALRAARLIAAGTDAFAATDDAPQGARLCLGTLNGADETRRTLELLAELLDQAPALTRSVI
ncbi:PLP-dependent aminotransferase family protein [Magnetospirillum aberrantis]|uniref:PLP-dependent aminotransferase family protein n=1 Tax=Magnetospirillum aberrantis SpK TaxID=908842 RepID=A0A7C9QS60_9PROT|nr:PLP-dependent aminotransferase family protein [Magnetospirillum aberrantis]NFV78879.1 PLP-dependent aminotransferase family protein [Magnetospirillum aberrantis SpK]